MYRYQVGTFERVMFNVKSKDNPYLDLAAREMDKHRLDGKQVVGEGFAKLLDPSLEATEGEPEISRLLHDAVEGHATYRRLQRSCKGKTGLSASVAATLFPQAIAGLPEPSPQDEQDQPGEGDQPGLTPAQESKLRRAIRRAVSAANEVVDDHQDGQRVFGPGWSDDDGEMVGGEYEGGACDQWIDNAKLRNILRLAGRLVPISEKKAAKTRAEGIGGLVGVKKGRSADALPHEYAKLASPDLNPLFYARYAGRTLDVWKRESQRDQGLGPMIVCLDQSGSMGGDCDTIAKAITLAMGAQARLEGRDFAVILYDKRVRLVAEGHSPSDLMEAIGYRPNGGTSFAAPLRAALDLIEKAGDFEKADVFLVTDGSAPGVPEVRQDLEERGVEVTGIAVLCGVSEGLAQSTHRVHTLDELTTPKAAKLLEEI